jgi:predicted 3-demethylubiquinone-9 3-methyltransferase (glyoxalase superfamily)
MQKITPFLWFNGNVRDAVDFYRSVFPNSRVLNTTPGPNGKLLGATFELEGQTFIAFDGGPQLEFNPAVSMYVNCETQDEVDNLWARLVEGGKETQCGWLEDRFGLSWQIIPAILPRLLGDPDRARADRALQAMLQMKKIDIAALEAAFAG